MMELGADLKKANNDGWTPLSCAAANGHGDVVQMLVAGGAEIDKATNAGWTPLYRAAYMGKTEVVKVLLSLGADRTKAAKDGKTPLDVARNDEIRRMLQGE